MGRKPCCEKEGVNRGAWTVKEDRILTTYINIHGEGKWRGLPRNAGLNRCGKSCRLRWLNYLKPDIKRGNISAEEEDLIIRLHKLLGNRWSLIARRLPGRTDNEIKNYWNTTLTKKIHSQKKEIPSKKQKIMEEKFNARKQDLWIQPNALKCAEVVQSNNDTETSVVKDQLFKSDNDSPSSSSSFDIFKDFDINDILFSDFTDILEFEDEKRTSHRENNKNIKGDFDSLPDNAFDIDLSISAMESFLNGSSTGDESIFMDDSEAMFASIDQPNKDSEPMFSEVRSFFNFEDEWLNE